MCVCVCRKLGTAGQKLGGSAALCHIRHDPAEPGGCFTLTAANVGKCQAVLCRDGKPLPLSEVHNVGVAEEYHRVRLNKAIITEVWLCGVWLGGLRRHVCDQQVAGLKSGHDRVMSQLTLPPLKNIRYFV